MVRPLVTIISPTHNQERFVAACAESALSQTYGEWEQVFVDDGSTDRTLEVIESYRDPRIRLVSLPHAGLTRLDRSYNAALSVSRGSLVAILEGDDRWPPDKLEVQVPAFNAPDTVLTWGRAELIDERDVRVGEQASLHGGPGGTRITTAEAFHRLTRSNFLVPTVTVMVRRDALDAVGGFRQTGSTMLVDLPTWLWVTATRDGYVQFVNHELGIYRLHEAQTSRQKRSQMTREHFAVVGAVEKALPPGALARARWTAASRHRAESRARLAEGEIALREGDFRRAGPPFMQALRLRASVADMALAAAGMLSTITRLDLVRAALATRAWVRRPRQWRRSDTRKV